ncbi:glycerate kinase [Pseudactinotalea terrae]|uniref:glycerate kinase n=1 Tax=Pseudactinotalea terrae TaxID=1743262 RepID=UPI0012E26F08|nr:glycerate kinase [Pseudactinotalea terrae]
MSAATSSTPEAVPAGPRVLLAPDKFKGTLTGQEAAEAMSAGVHDWAPGAQVRQVVVADGGEGTVDAALGAGATAVTTTVQGPLGDSVTAGWAVLGSMAVIELSAASGLQLLEPSDTTAGTAHTFGTGQLVRAALDRGMTRIVIGVGGSASTDGGTGLLRALGARFLDAAGQPLELGGADLVRLADVDLGSLDPRLRSVTLTVICDVAAPLLGPEGAIAMFSTQKGASPATQEVLERGLASLAAAIDRATGRDIAALDWGGAAGGTAGGLHGVLGAEFVSGIDFIAELTGLAGHLAWADLVITGEGSFDRQSLRGKAPLGVIERAVAAGVPAVVVAGRVEMANEQLQQIGIRAWASAENAAPEPQQAIGPSAAHWVREATRHALHDLGRNGAAAAPGSRPARAGATTDPG